MRRESLILVGIHFSRDKKSTIEVAIPVAHERPDGTHVFRYEKDSPTLFMDVDAEVIRNLFDLKSKIDKDTRSANSREIILKVDLDEEAIESQFKKE